MDTCGWPLRPWGLLAILIIFLALGLIYSAVVPLFEPPDELWHLAFADYLAKGTVLPVFKATKSPFGARAASRRCFIPCGRWILPSIAVDFSRPGGGSMPATRASHQARTSDTPMSYPHGARRPALDGQILAAHPRAADSLLLSEHWRSQHICRRDARSPVGRPGAAGRCARRFYGPVRLYLRLGHTTTV